MKKILLMACLILASQFSFGQQALNDVLENFNKLDWLVGNWARLNMKPGSAAQEQWVKVSNSEFKGIGLTIKGQDTVFKENLRLLIKENAIYYVADVAHNKQPVYFKLTSLSDSGFTCENPEHDFPKKITYLKEGDTLKATISGSGKSVGFLFRKE